MKPIKDTVTNAYGLKIEIEQVWVEKIGDYLIDLKNTAKLVLYMDAKKLLSAEAEKKELDFLERLDHDGLMALMLHKKEEMSNATLTKTKNILKGGQPC